MKARTAVLLDAGPLVAIVNANDAAHHSCTEALRKVPRRTELITVCPVLTEAFYLVSNIDQGRERLFDLIEILKVSLEPLTAPTLVRMRELMRRYHDLPMDFADAALVVTAESLQARSIFTLDQRGFRIYRPSHIKHFEVLP